MPIEERKKQLEVQKVKLNGSVTLETGKVEKNNTKSIFFYTNRFVTRKIGFPCN
jgi:hypothetical protein